MYRGNAAMKGGVIYADSTSVTVYQTLYFDSYA